LWDLDGTLMDTGELHYQSWAAVLRKLGIDFTRERFFTGFGSNNTAVLTDLFGPVTPEFVQQVGGDKEQWFRDNIVGNVRLLPGVTDWLTRFRDWGWAQAIVSSAPMANVDALVDALQIREYFDLLVSAAKLPSKPDPAGFLQASSVLQIPPQACLVVEDSPVGVQGAANAGMASIAVQTHHSAGALAGASLILPDLSHLEPEMVFDLLHISHE